MHKKISNIILISIIICGFWGCATTPSASRNTPTQYAGDQTQPVSRKSCACGNDAAVSQQLTKLKAENNALKRQLENTHSELNALQTTRLTQQNHRQTQDNVIDELRTKLQTTQEELDTLTTENGKLKEQITQLTQENEENQSQIITLRAKRDKLKNQVKQLEENSHTTEPVENHSPQNGSSGGIYIFKEDE